MVKKLSSYRKKIADSFEIPLQEPVRQLENKLESELQFLYKSKNKVNSCEKEIEKCKPDDSVAATEMLILEKIENALDEWKKAAPKDEKKVDEKTVLKKPGLNSEAKLLQKIEQTLSAWHTNTDSKNLEMTILSEIDAALLSWKEGMQTRSEEKPQDSLHFLMPQNNHIPFDKSSADLENDVHKTECTILQVPNEAISTDYLSDKTLETHIKNDIDDSIIENAALLPEADNKTKVSRKEELIKSTDLEKKDDNIETKESFKESFFDQLERQNKKEDKKCIKKYDLFPFVADFKTNETLEYKKDKKSQIQEKLEKNAQKSQVLKNSKDLAKEQVKAQNAQSENKEKIAKHAIANEKADQLGLNTALHEKRLRKPLRIFSFCLLPLLLVAALIGGLINVYFQYASIAHARIQAQIVKEFALAKIGKKNPSTDAANPLESHIETNASVSYKNTKWKEYKNLSYKYAFNYAKNASYLMNNVDNSEIWLLRKNGFIFKVTAYSYVTQSLADCVNTSIDKTQYGISDGAFAQQKAKVLTANNQNSNTSGNEYVLLYHGNILVIWYKSNSLGIDSDDLLREKDILQSFTLL